MPRFDGTGPRGRGPGTGRGRGRCGVFATLCDARRPSGRVFLSLAATVAGVIAKDAMNPQGITRTMVRALGSRLAGSLRDSDALPERQIRNAEYEVLQGLRKTK